MGSSVFAMTLMACYGCPDNQCGGTALPDASTEGGGGTADTRTPATPGIPDASADRNVADADASSDAGADADAADGG